MNLVKSWFNTVGWSRNFTIFTFMKGHMKFSASPPNIMYHNQI